MVAISLGVIYLYSFLSYIFSVSYNDNGSNNTVVMAYACHLASFRFSQVVDLRFGVVLYVDRIAIRRSHKGSDRYGVV